MWRDVRRRASARHSGSSARERRQSKKLLTLRGKPSAIALNVWRPSVTSLRSWQRNYSKPSAIALHVWQPDATTLRAWQRSMYLGLRQSTSRQHRQATWHRFRHHHHSNSCLKSELCL